MKPHCLSLLLLLVLLPVFVSALGRGALVGGWQAIQNIKDPHVKEIGQFAVTEYNKESKTNLKFESVVKGETQVVSGTNYKLVVAVNDGAGTKKYEAIVWEKPWENVKNLTSFKPVKA